jgi:hypothetical protein
VDQGRIRPGYAGNADNADQPAEGRNHSRATFAINIQRHRQKVNTFSPTFRNSRKVNFRHLCKGGLKKKYRTPSEKAPLQPVQRNLPTYLPRNPSNNLYSSQFDGFPEISDGKYKASQRNTVETGNNDGLWGNFDGFGNKSPVESVQKGPHLKKSNPNLPTYLSDRVRYLFFCVPLQNMQI